MSVLGRALILAFGVFIGFTASIATAIALAEGEFSWKEALVVWVVTGCVSGGLLASAVVASP